jgi:hypothetical protein
MEAEANGEQGEQVVSAFGADDDVGLRLKVHAEKTAEATVAATQGRENVCMPGS